MSEVRCQQGVSPDLRPLTSDLFVRITHSQRLNTSCFSSKTCQIKALIRELTRRKRGRSLAQVIGELNAFTCGWWNYFRIAAANSQLPALRGWIFRRLRALVWHQWKNPRTRVRRLKGAGVGHENARKTGNARKKAWRLSTNEWVVITLPNRHFIHHGLVPLGT